jgi:thiosulfate/3-mercaptopyruvate sulfurtransferase
MVMEHLQARPDLLVDADWLDAHRHDARVRVIDCSAALVAQPVGASQVISGRAAWQQAHVPGALFFDLKEDLSEPRGHLAYNLPSAARMTALLSRAGVDTETTVVLYGARYPSAVTRAWWVLRASGVRDVRILSGGLQRWQALGKPVDALAPRPPFGNFVAVPQARWLARRTDVERALADGSAVVVNALSSQQFLGTGGSHYGRPGRIPGSVNVPTATLFNAEGVLHDMATLRAIFTQAGVLQHDAVIAYCGGGIAASATVFALSLLGHPDVRLYDGSLLEWSNVPELPMVTG